MLKHLRSKHIQKNIYIFLAVIIIPSFVITGVVLFTPDQEQASRTLGSIANRKISLQDYLDSYRALQRQAMMIYGDQYAQVRERLNLRKESWDRLLLLDHAKKLGIRVSEEEIIGWVESQELFKKNGRFDFNFYTMYLDRALGLRPQEFEAEIREMLALSKVRDRVEKDSAITDEELRRLYAERFAPRDLAWSFLSSAGMEASVEVSEQDIQQIYEVVRDRLTDPEKINIRYLFVPREQAEASKDLLSDDAATIEELSKRSSLTPQETGFFSRNDAAPGIGAEQQVLTQAFTLPLDGESGWIEGRRGFYKIRLADRQAERPLTAEESTNTLRELLARDKAQSQALEKLRSLAERAEKEGFETVMTNEKIAVRMNEKVRPGDMIGDVQGSEIAGPAFEKLAEGSLSSVIAVPGGALLLKVLRIGEIDESRFTADKDAFRKAASQEKIEQKMNELLEGLRKELKVDEQAMRSIFENSQPAAAQPASSTR